MHFVNHRPVRIGKRRCVLVHHSHAFVGDVLTVIMYRVDMHHVGARVMIGVVHNHRFIAIERQRVHRLVNVIHDRAS